MPLLLRSILAGLALATAVAVAACGGGSPTAPSAGVAYSSTDIDAGTGAVASSGNVVTVNYTGWLYSASAVEHKGTQFDTSIGRTPFVFKLGAGSVIQGWDRGVVGMHVGGTRRLVVPPDLAYGSAGAGGGVIPGNATLVFDIELLAVQ